MAGEDGVAAGPGKGAAAGEDRAKDSAALRAGKGVDCGAPGERGDAAEFHPIAEVWPLLHEPELQELADDVKANGLHNPIWRHRDGRILDGRNRWLACRRAGVDCPSNTYEGQDGAELIAFVVSLNDKRRHLTTDQRAAIAAEIANLGHGQKKADAAAAVSQPEAARLMGVSVDSVQRAQAVRRADPELHAKVKRGEIKAGRARAEVARKQGKVAAPAKKAKTRASPAAPPAKDPVAPALLGSARPTGARNKSGLDLLGEITSLQKGRDGGQ
jgi:ParB-like chromosome segregation protein Spo0J